MYSEKELEFFYNLKEQIVGKHKPCKGVGYLDGLVPCDCMNIFNYLKALKCSRIPMDYWALSLEKLEVDVAFKRLTSEFIKNLDNAIQQGLGLMFLGDRGIGKTSLMCEIGKHAIAKRYNVYYEIAQRIVDDKFTEDQEIIQRIHECDLVLIDELDKVAMRENSNIPKQIENLLRELLPDQKSIIINTNLSEDEVDDKFKFMSLLKRYIKIVQMTGQDFSDQKQKAWMEKLNNNAIDYFSPEITKMARMFYQNQHRADEREFRSMT